MMLFRYISLSVVGFLALHSAGCKVGPNYEQPDVDVPADWRASRTEGPSLAEQAWSNVFVDETLQQLIKTALEQNLDLQLAAARIREARGVARSTKSLRLPQIGAVGEFESETSRDIKITEPRTIDMELDPGPGADPTKLDVPITKRRKNVTPFQEETWLVGLEVGWEVDLFGKIGREIESAEADLTADLYHREAIRLALIASVAQAYYELRDLDNRLSITLGTVQARESAVQLAQLRYDAGLTAQLEMRQAEVELAQTNSIVPDLRFLISEKENAIRILLGEQPGDIDRGLSIDEQPLPLSSSAGMPGELLARRPDIRAAEMQLVSTNALVGAAIANFYPDLTLSGAFGQESDKFRRIPDPDYILLNFIANITAPIYTFGSLEGNLDAARARYDQALIVYKRALLRALRETNNALDSYRRVGEVRGYQERLVDASRDYLRLARLQYQNGIVGYIDVLDAQRSLFDAELQLSISIRDQLLAVVLLYKSLGGGWDPETISHE